MKIGSGSWVLGAKILKPKPNAITKTRKDEDTKEEGAIEQ
jgi:hypothetical protein